MNREKAVKKVVPKVVPKVNTKVVPTVKEDSKTEKVEIKRSLTDPEIDEILSFFKDNSYIPIKISQNIISNMKNDLKEQLKKQHIYPSLIPALKAEIEKNYKATLINPGECVGIVTAQSIGEKQTQANLSGFHKAGSSDKQPVVSKFSELLNATNKPKSPSYFIYLNQGNDNLPNLRKTINHTLVQLTFKKITLDLEICIDKQDEKWYDIFKLIHPSFSHTYKDCISLKINMDILYEYKLTLKDIADKLALEYSDVYCIYSPDCIGQLDVFIDTSEIDIDETLVFITKENCKQIYLEETWAPILEQIIICGVPGILNMFFIKGKNEWFIETENSREKIPENTRFKNIKNKPLNSVKRYKQVLAHPKVDFSRTISNNIWDIYYTLGIEAVRNYMIEQFSEIMEGINTCHVMLLVDKMTFTGGISSVSRYTMRQEETGVFSKTSFEETCENFLNAAVYGQNEPGRGVSSAIVCGKRANIGTGLCELEVDLEKIMELDETEVF